MVRGKKRRYIFKALGTVWPNGKKKNKEDYVAEIQHARRKTAYGDSEASRNQLTE